MVKICTSTKLSKITKLKEIDHKNKIYNTIFFNYCKTAKLPVIFTSDVDLSSKVVILIYFQLELDRIYQTLQLLKDRNNPIASNSQVISSYRQARINYKKKNLFWCKLSYA
jgi:hypothetical protein